MTNVEENIFLARVAEQAERFEDMVDFLEQVLAEKGGSVNPDERNLLSVAFKNLISSKRAACRTISAIEQNPKYSKFNADLLEYKQKIETQLMADCQKVIDMINNRVLNGECTDEAKAFFVKMVGDYYRYIAENAKDAKLEDVKAKAKTAYEEANNIDLPACNPIKLGLALNFSVFNYEVLKDHAKACQLADDALQQALDKIDELEEDDFRDAKSIIELLKENLTLWKDEEEGGNGDQELEALEFISKPKGDKKDESEGEFDFPEPMVREDADANLVYYIEDDEGNEIILGVKYYSPYEEADLYVHAFADMDFGPEDDESDDEYPAFLSMGPHDDEEEPRFDHYEEEDVDGNIVHRFVDLESGDEMIVAVEWLVEFNGEPFYMTA